MRCSPFWCHLRPAMTLPPARTNDGAGRKGARLRRSRHQVTHQSRSRPRAPGWACGAPPPRPGARRAPSERLQCTSFSGLQGFGEGGADGRSEKMEGARERVAREKPQRDGSAVRSRRVCARTKHSASIVDTTSFAPNRSGPRAGCRGRRRRRRRRCCRSGARVAAWRPRARPRASVRLARPGRCPPPRLLRPAANEPCSRAK